MPAPLPSRVCLACGRDFAWRKKWARDWDQVRYCSKACRRAGPPKAPMEALRARLTQTRLVVLDAATAQELQCEEEGLLRAARLLAQAGQAQLLSRGRPVSPTEARGPLTLRRA